MEKKNSEMSYRHDLWTTNVLVFFSPWIGKIRLVLYQYYIKFTRNWITWFKKGAQPNHNSINMWLNSLILINKYYLDPPSLLPSEPWKVHNFKQVRKTKPKIHNGWEGESDCWKVDSQFEDWSAIWGESVLPMSKIILKSNNLTKIWYYIHTHMYAFTQHIKKKVFY